MSKFSNGLWPVQALSEVCAICNDAHIEYKDGRFHAVGAPTEAALVVLVEKLGVADAGLKSRIQQQRATSPEGHADGTCQAYCRRWVCIGRVTFRKDGRACVCIVACTISGLCQCHAKR